MRLVGSRTGKPNATPTARSRSSASSCVLTSCAATTFARVELLEQAAHDRRLAGADLAGDDDEALALVQAVLQVRERALVPRLPKKNAGSGLSWNGLPVSP